MYRIMPDACYTSLSPSHEKCCGNEGKDGWMISEDAMTGEDNRPILCELATRLVNSVDVASRQLYRPYSFPALRALPFTQLVSRYLCAESP
jgi:hypothetical protein